MKIGVDIRPLAEPALTGIGHYTVEILREFSERSMLQGDKLCLFSSGYKPRNPILKRLLLSSNIEHVHVPLPNKLINLTLRSSLSPSIELFAPNLDYLWLPNINFYTARGTIPYAVTVHDLSFLHMPSLYSLKRRLWHRAIALTRLLDRADKIITLSENTKEDILFFFPQLKSKPIQVIYPGISGQNIVSDDIAAFKKKHHLGNNVILFVGTLEPRKNVALLIKAFRRLIQTHHNTELVIAGKYGWLQRKLRTQFADDTRIRWFGYVSEKEKHMLYSIAKIFVWPSLYEGFGFPPLESLTHGATVITSYRTSLPEVLLNHAIYINPHNCGELVEVLKQAMDRSDSATKPGYDALKHYNWKIAAQNTLDFLKS